MQPLLNVVILAAGKGTRMYSALPKVLHPIAGKPLLQHVIDTARHLKPVRICVVYGYGGQQVIDTINKNAQNLEPNLIWAEQAQQLGTGHAVQQALPHLQETGTTLILYGDVPLTRLASLTQLEHIAATGSVGLMTINLKDPSGYGRIVRNGSGQVAQIVEQKDATDEQLLIKEINTGIMIVPNRYLSKWLPALKNQNAQSEYYLTDIISMAVADGIDIKTCQPQDEWEVMGINSKAQLAQLERIKQHNQAHRLLDQGVTLLDPARIDIRGELSCGKDVTIDVNCVFLGKVSLGDNVSVGANCVLRDVDVAAGTQIAPFSLIEQSQIAENCRVGPYARLRPGARLQRDAHIGNFVEIKNSEIDQGSKVNHLSYVGDASVGKNVNIGAGTITCNYDGANKYRTIIEDDVFIGSSTQLVAPVTIQKGATIGAGSTITEDAPAGELTLARARQTTIAGWQRPKKQKSEKPTSGE